MEAIIASIGVTVLNVIATTILKKLSNKNDDKMIKLLNTASELVKKSENIKTKKTGSTSSLDSHEPFDNQSLNEISSEMNIIQQQLKKQNKKFIKNNPLMNLIKVQIEEYEKNINEINNITQL